MIGSATDVFVSYKAEDRERLRPLVAALEAEGFSVWWDAHISGGVHWREDIQEHLDAAKCVIVAWSRRSVGPDGDFVRDEAARARKRGAYLPIRLDLVEPPLGFGQVQAILLKGWKGDRSDPRFGAIVEAVRRRIAGEDIAHVTVPRDLKVSRRVVVGGGLAAVAAAGLGGWLLIRSSAVNSKRIAVLPFANLSSGSDQAYFSEGVAEEIRSALSRIGLQVIGRNSSEAVKDLDIKAVAAKLDVANVLTGSIRRSPERIRINAQLVNAADSVERWSQSYDRATGDAIAVQTDIAAKVATSLSIALGQAGRSALALGGTKDSVAQDLVLRARELFIDSNGSNVVDAALALIDQALRRDPNYATAYVEKTTMLNVLSTSYAVDQADAMRKLAQADVTANKAIAIAPGLAAAHAALAELKFSELDFKGALNAIEHALQLSAEDPNVLMGATRIIGRLKGEEGVELVERMTALDPLNARAFRRKSMILKNLRHYRESIVAGQRALQLAPQGWSANIFIGDSFALLGDAEKARAAYHALPQGDTFRVYGDGIVAAMAKDQPAVERTAATMLQLFGDTVYYQLAEIRAHAGNIDQAFDALGKAIAGKDTGLVELKVDPFLDPIRGDPRYGAMIRQLKFP